jgi:transcriptional regulator GlxA family with amidase domain
MDSGSWLLAAAGLLAGRRATIHWDELELFAERFPEVEVVEAPTVADGNILSCGGASTTFELVLGLIEQHHGPMLRIEVASIFLPAGGHARPGVEAAAETAPDPGGILSLMRRHIEEPLSIGEIAARLGLGPKTLERDCRRLYGIAPRQLYRAIRLRAIRRLVENTALPIEEIAARGGYRNAPAMTRAFRSEFGLTPSALRRAARDPGGVAQAARRRPSASK